MRKKSGTAKVGKEKGGRLQADSIPALKSAVDHAVIDLARLLPDRDVLKTGPFLNALAYWWACRPIRERERLGVRMVRDYDSYRAAGGGPVTRIDEVADPSPSGSVEGSVTTPLARNRPGRDKKGSSRTG